MAGDSDHKPLKPAHPAVKSIAGTRFTASHTTQKRECTWLTFFVTPMQALSEVLLKHAVSSP